MPPLSFTHLKYAFAILPIVVKSTPGTSVKIPPSLIGAPLAFLPLPSPHTLFVADALPEPTATVVPPVASAASTSAAAATAAMTPTATLSLIEPIRASSSGGPRVRVANRSTFCGTYCRRSSEVKKRSNLRGWAVHGGEAPVQPGDRAGRAAPPDRGDRRRPRPWRGRVRAVRTLQGEDRPVRAGHARPARRREARLRHRDHADARGRGQDDDVGLAHAGARPHRQAPRALPARGVGGPRLRDQGRCRGRRARAGRADGGPE